MERVDPQMRSPPHIHATTLRHLLQCACLQMHLQDVVNVCRGAVVV
jgi:hypothetical protein